MRLTQSEQYPAGLRHRLRALLRSGVLLALLLGLILPRLSVAQTEDMLHAPWSKLLQGCVRATPEGHSTAVDYGCFASRNDDLDNYLNSLSAVSEKELLSWPRDSQLAFLINAYNAWTVKLILSAWPDIQSIRELGSLLRSPWKKAFIPLLGDTVSLDDIEHGMIRAPGRFDEPRIHFAVNCASIGCPALRREAFIAADLEIQLEDQTRSFLGDPSRNRLNNGYLEISSIFKWYRDDFERLWRDSDSLERFLGGYAEALGLSPREKQQILDGELPIEFLEYDWRLNAVP
jgi:hypothetical protein